jgi:lipoic acid synthetase
LRMILDAGPDVIAHNLETVEKLTSHVRDRRSSYTISLDVLKTLKELEPRNIIKSGIMVGLGERNEEVYQTMKDMRDVNVDILTIGQYLQPTRRHLAVDRFVTPQQFAEYEEKAKQMGFLAAASAPLVRSS